MIIILRIEIDGTITVIFFTDLECIKGVSPCNVLIRQTLGNQRLKILSVTTLVSSLELVSSTLCLFNLKTPVTKFSFHFNKTRGIDKRSHIPSTSTEDLNI